MAERKNNRITTTTIIESLELQPQSKQDILAQDFYKEWLQHSLIIRKLGLPSISQIGAGSTTTTSTLLLHLLSNRFLQLLPKLKVLQFSLCGLRSLFFLFFFFILFPTLLFILFSLILVIIFVILQYQELTTIKKETMINGEP